MSEAAIAASAAPGATTVEWPCPAPGAFTRQLRFGEWIFEPVTPLFESWLLPAMEGRLHRQLGEWTGQGAPLPHHVIVHGWYFYSLNWLSLGTTLRNLPSLIAHIIRSPRRVAGMIPPTVRHSVGLYERDWREDLQPRYRRAVSEAEGAVETLGLGELPTLIDRLADLAGEYFASIAALGGAAYKVEMNLAMFYRRHLAQELGGSQLPLVAGLVPPTVLPRHAVVSLDWWHAPVSASLTERSSAAFDRTVAARQTAEVAARGALAASPKRLAAFDRLLALAQRLVPIREEQAAELTLPWPVMHRAVVRIGEAIAASGGIPQPEDVFFLTRHEVLDGLAGRLAAPPDVMGRRTERAANARLGPPLVIGHLNPILRRVWETFPKLVGGVVSARALVSGAPASAGRVTGSVRVIRGPEMFGELQPGEILVAPVTAPAWTPLFERAAGVVTDVGSAAAHASIIAREYGIPAVVGCGNATTRLVTGMRVTVDGTTGNVEPA